YQSTLLPPLWLRLRYLFFFFQAEDGIRDFHVTGVQTCALPIFTFDEVHHYLFQLFAVHLPMRTDYACIRYKLHDKVTNCIYLSYAVMNKKNLSSTTQFIGYSITYHFFLKSIQLRRNGLAVRRRGSND